MKICSLASGSKGNCLYLETGDTRVLIDVGMSLRETLLRMEGCGIDPAGIHAVLVTHEHIDHIRSAGSFSRERSDAGAQPTSTWLSARLRTPRPRST